MPFAAWHLEHLTLQASQQTLSPLLTRQYGEALAQHGQAFTAMTDREIVACAGIITFWAGRAQVWSLLSDVFPRYRKSVHQAVKRHLLTYRVARLECIVDPRAPEAIRWAEHLGFTYESRLRKYNPDGSDQFMYVRIE